MLQITDQTLCLSCLVGNDNNDINADNNKPCNMVSEVTHSDWIILQFN